eukprot:COSAG02_NODE_12656_length_1513_cov_3.750354_1_plen_182_part_01
MDGDAGTKDEFDCTGTGFDLDLFAECDPGTGCNVETCCTVEVPDECAVPASDGDWADLTTAEVDAAIVLGWDEASWDCLGDACVAPASDEKAWSGLTADELAAAEALGWTEEMWNCGTEWEVTATCGDESFDCTGTGFDLDPSAACDPGFGCNVETCCTVEVPDECAVPASDGDWADLTTAE